MSRANLLVTLLTDFGLEDPFVGVMKGVIYATAPAARVVDLTHGIARQDVAAAAFWLSRSFGYFAPGTTHVAVVDPGVGGTRRALVARAHGHVFVGPDNGLLAGVIATDPESSVFSLDPARAGRGAPLSRTFHGRDLFAPAAARVAAGAPASALGDEIDPRSLVASPFPRPLTEGPLVRGVVLFADHFGNLFTNLDAALVPEGSWSLRCAGVEAHAVGTYAEAEPGKVVALVNSFGVVELAVQGGSAARELGIGAGAPVDLRLEGDAATTRRAGL